MRFQDFWIIPVRPRTAPDTKRPPGRPGAGQLRLSSEQRFKTLRVDQFAAGVDQFGVLRVQEVGWLSLHIEKLPREESIFLSRQRFDSFLHFAPYGERRREKQYRVGIGRNRFSHRGVSLCVQLFFQTEKSV